MCLGSPFLVNKLTAVSEVKAPVQPEVHGHLREIKSFVQLTRVKHPSSYVSKSGDVIRKECTKS